MYSQALKSGRQRGGCGDGSIATAADPRTGYERLTGQTPDRYGRQGAFSGVTPNAALETKPVFYAHGTLDNNLTYSGNEIGCSDEGVETCQIPEDPKYSMDPGGDDEDHDDRSSVDWLLHRHALSRVPGMIVPDERPNSGNDNVTTHSYLVEGGSQAANTGATILWYEMRRAKHSMSRIDTTNHPSVSKDYDVSVHTQRFFEDHAGMLK